MTGFSNLWVDCGVWSQQQTWLNPGLSLTHSHSRTPLLVINNLVLYSPANNQANIIQYEKVKIQMKSDIKKVVKGTGSMLRPSLQVSLGSTVCSIQPIKQVLQQWSERNGKC